MGGVSHSCVYGCYTVPLMFQLPTVHTVLQRRDARIECVGAIALYFS